MTLFLLCSFLTLRQKNGEVSAEGGERSAEGDFCVNYQCSVSFVETEEDFSVGNTSQNEILPLFLSDPCFSDLVATSVDGGMRLETRFPVLKKEGRLCSLGDEDWVCLEFCILGVLNSNV